MKMTIVTGQDGALVAAQHGDGTQPDTGTVAQFSDFRAGLRAGPGQSIRVIDVPDELAQVASPAEMEAKLKTVLSSARV